MMIHGRGHMLLCAGNSAHTVYHSLYVRLKANGVGSGYTTFVFPDYICKVVRERFATTGLYDEADEQYSERADVYPVTTDELAETEWPSPTTVICSREDWTFADNNGDWSSEQEHYGDS